MEDLLKRSLIKLLPGTALGNKPFRRISIKSGTPEPQVGSIYMQSKKEKRQKALERLIKSHMAAKENIVKVKTKFRVEQTMMSQEMQDYTTRRILCLEDSIQRGEKEIKHLCSLLGTSIEKL